METIGAVGNVQDVEARGKSAIGFPAYGLADSVAVADAIHNKAGGHATREQLAAFLEYKSTENGAFWSRISAAKMFRLIVEENGYLSLAPHAQQILMPESADQQRQALVDAFLAVPLFKAIYEEYQGKDLPQGLGLQNALRNRFKVKPKRVDLAIKNFFEAAEHAKFFETRGSKTQLIIPVISNKPQHRPSPEQQGPPKQDQPNNGGGGGGGGGGEQPPIIGKTRDDLRNEYISTLIDALREKGKHGEIDKDLMGTIERLLDLKNA